MAVKASVYFRNDLEGPWWESHYFFLLLNLLLSVSWLCSSYVEMCKKPKLFQFGFSWPPPKICLCVASFKLIHADCGCSGKEYHCTMQNWRSLLWVRQTKMFWPFWCVKFFSYINCLRNVMYLFTPLGSNIVRSFLRSCRWTQNLFKINHLKSLEKNSMGLNELKPVS